MSYVGYSICFFVSWWLFLFMVLPIGVQNHHEADEEITDGIEAAAPVNSDIKKKMLITTVIAVVFTSLVGVIDYLDLIKIN